MQGILNEAKACLDRVVFAPAFKLCPETDTVYVAARAWQD
jgi:hypothetical protein